MAIIEFQVGDVFATRNPMALGAVIRGIERLWSRDSAANYSHSGIITSVNGDTFEALWTYAEQNIHVNYGDNKVLVARYTGTPRIGKLHPHTAIARLRREYKGRMYPFWRLALHMIPPLAKINAFNRPVCSELVAMYLHMIGARPFPWPSTNPDTLVDEWRMWRDFEIVFEGVPSVR